MLFSDRFWTIKVLLAAGLFGWLCSRADRELSELRPMIESTAGPIEGHRGKGVSFWAKRVLAVRPDGFDVQSKVGPIHIVAASPYPKAGDYVSAVGRIVERRRIEATATYVNQTYLWKRGLTYGVSVATVLAYLWLIRRRFRWRASEGIFRSRY